MGIIVLPAIVFGFVVGALTTLFLCLLLRRSRIHQQIVSGEGGALRLRLTQVALTLLLWFLLTLIPDALDKLPLSDNSATAHDSLAGLWVAMQLFCLLSFLFGLTPGIAAVLSVFLLKLIRQNP